MPTSLTHFYGRKVERVRSNNSTPHRWVIVLSGSVQIRNRDEEQTAPPIEISGSSFLVADFSVDETVLKFGNSFPPSDDFPEGRVEITGEVHFDLGKYSIATPDTAMKEVVPDEYQGEPDDTPPDPSADRVADGPTEEVEE